MKGLLKQLASFHTNSFVNPYGIDLDLSYITDRIIVCSCPTTKATRAFYRNDLADLVNYLNIHHGDHWHVWNLRSEMDDDSYDINDKLLLDHISYNPWRDHESPTFEYLISILNAIGEYLEEDTRNVAVIHCKLGKGRSGLVCVGVLIMYFGYTLSGAETMFTQKRMRPGFGAGLSIKSQRQYALYVDQMRSIPYAPVTKSIKIYSIWLSTGNSTSGVSQIAATISIEVEFPLAELESKKTLSFEAQESSNDPIMNATHVMFTPPFTSDQCLIPLDFKIVVEKVLSPSLPIKSSYCFTCINLYWENVLHSNDDKMTANMTKKTTGSKGNNYIVTSVNWDRFDGYKGLVKKGVKTFESMEIQWGYV